MFNQFLLHVNGVEKHGKVQPSMRSQGFDNEEIDSELCNTVFTCSIRPGPNQFGWNAGVHGPAEADSGQVRG